VSFPGRSAGRRSGAARIAASPFQHVATRAGASSMTAARPAGSRRYGQSEETKPPSASRATHASYSLRAGVSRGRKAWETWCAPPRPEVERAGHVARAAARAEELDGVLGAKDDVVREEDGGVAAAGDERREREVADRGENLKSHGGRGHVRGPAHCPLVDEDAAGDVQRGELVFELAEGGRGVVAARLDDQDEDDVLAGEERMEQEHAVPRYWTTLSFSDVQDGRTFSLL
jgi:hypothetical protein